MCQRFVSKIAKLCELFASPFVIVTSNMILIFLKTIACTPHLQPREQRTFVDVLRARARAALLDDLVVLRLQYETKLKLHSALET